MATFYGFNPPFFGGPEVVMSRQEDDRLIKNDLLQLLLTVPGERVNRPNFGVNLRNFVFEDSSPSSLSLLASGVREAVIAQEPRINILDLQIASDPNTNLIKLSLAFNLKADPTRVINLEQFLTSD
ncbi:GPW/gp25 family protein [bacterium]|nr:GPW/gp25 family protein [bacterium]